jgi:hypothetical protein
VASEPQVPMNKVSFLTYMGSTIGHQLWPSLLYSFPLGLLCHLLWGESGVHPNLQAPAVGLLSSSHMSPQICPAATSASAPQHSLWDRESIEVGELKLLQATSSGLCVKCPRSQSDHSSRPCLFPRLQNCTNGTFYLMINCSPSRAHHISWLP